MNAAALKTFALAIHRRLLPGNSGRGWSPYIWLPYLGFLSVEWFYRPVGVAELAGTVTAVCLFLAMYFRSYRARPRETPWLIAGMAALGLALSPFNIGAEVFLIFAAATCGYAGLGARTSLVLLTLTVALQVAELLAVGRPVGQWIWAPFIALMVGLANLNFGERARKNKIIEQSREEIRRLAAAAERERIARDLHDLLGHTLTLITVKAELAGTLAERDLPQAANEIHELEKIARDALAQVRQAVGGYRGDLVGEIANAGVTLRAAGIAFEAEAPADISAGSPDAALAMIVREAITNVVRHAGATSCRLSLRREAESLVLEIIDNGANGRRAEGNGIRGMRERVQAAGGVLDVDFGMRGVCLRAAIPARQTTPPHPNPLPGGEGAKEARRPIGGAA